MHQRYHRPFEQADEMTSERRLAAPTAQFHPSVLIGVLVATALLIAGASTYAQEGTPEQQEACTPEVFRLCQKFIPDRTAIINCLESNKSKLNPACRAVFSPSPRMRAREQAVR